jgi:hypothetical protein
MTAVASRRPSLSTRPWSQMAGERFFRVCIGARFGAGSDPSFQTRPIQGAIRLIATSAVATRPLDVAPAVRFAQILLKKCAAIRVSMPLAHLARTGFFKPVHVKSLSAHALRSLIIARKKLVGQRVTLENQIRGLAIVFGIRLPRALTRAFVNQALKASKGIAGLSAAMRGLQGRARSRIVLADATQLLPRRKPLRRPSPSAAGTPWLRGYRVARPARSHHQTRPSRSNGAAWEPHSSTATV